MNKKYSFIALSLWASFLPTRNALAATLLSDSFSYANGLITNEYAFWNPSLPQSKKSTIWEMTSGSLFCNGGAGWTGAPPDNRDPNATSSNGNNSCVFRATTVRSDFGDVEVSVSLLNQGLSSTSSTPPVEWDGLHLWLRYQSETHLYYASVNRRDNTVIIKKKNPGGPSNGGTYYNLSPYVPFVVKYNQWQQVKASVVNNANGSVTIKLYNGGVLLVTAVDNGTIGGAPILTPGKVGMRGDNANLKFDNFIVSSLGGTSLPAVPGGVIASAGNQQVLLKWTAVPGATSYNIYRSRSAGVTKANGYKIATTKNPFTNAGFVNGTRYYMVVSAVNSAGESHESPEVSATPYQGGPVWPLSIDLPDAASIPVAFRVFPNPWKAKEHSALPITFDPLQPGSEVKIFSVAGQWVNTVPCGAASATWDLRNDAGEPVASGLYMYLVNDGYGEKKHGTLMIVR